MTYYNVNLIVSQNFIIIRSVNLKFSCSRLVKLSPVFDFKRPYSYSRYWTGTSLKWRLMLGNIIKKRLMSFVFERTPRMSLTCKLAPLTPIPRIRKRLILGCTSPLGEWIPLPRFQTERDVHASFYNLHRNGCISLNSTNRGMCSVYINISPKCMHNVVVGNQSHSLTASSTSSTSFFS